MTVLRLITEPEISQHREELCTWITALGIDPRDVVAPTWLSIERHADGSDHLHYRSYKRTGGGIALVDPEDGQRAWTELRSVPLVAPPPEPLSPSVAQAVQPTSQQHGTDDLYPYGGSYDEGRDYVIHCYCGVEFTGETDGSVEASLDEHVDQMDQAGDTATDNGRVELQQHSTLGAMLDQLDLTPSLEADERIEQALVIATVTKEMPDGCVRHRTVALAPAAANRLGMGFLLDFASDRARVIEALRHGR